MSVTTSARLKITNVNPHARRSCPVTNVTLPWSSVSMRVPVVDNVRTVATVVRIQFVPVVIQIQIWSMSSVRNGLFILTSFLF